MVEDVTEMMQQAKGGRKHRYILSSGHIPRLFYYDRGRERRLFSSFRRRIFGQPDMLRFPDDSIQQLILYRLDAALINAFFTEEKRMAMGHKRDDHEEQERLRKEQIL